MELFGLHWDFELVYDLKNHLYYKNDQIGVMELDEWMHLKMVLRIAKNKKNINQKKREELK